MKKLVLTVAGLVDENSERVLFEPVLRNAPRLVYYSDVQSLQAENDRLNAKATSDADLIKLLNASLAEARAERDRLREWLVDIEALASDEDESFEIIVDSVERMARKALEGEGQ